MKIFRTVEEIPFDPHTAVTVGTFDGVHLGHREVIRSLKEIAGQAGSRSLLITFEPHPQSVIRPGSIRLLTTPGEKLILLGESGVDVLLVLPFSKAFSRTGPEHFVGEVLNRKIGMRMFVLGEGHRFGNAKQGGRDMLQRLSGEFGFGIRIVPPFVSGGSPVSSTRIRGLLEDGHVAEAHVLLGRGYTFSGTVKPGRGIGSRIGFPTANIHPDHPLLLVPKDGVYAVRVQMEDRWMAGTCNIGFSPTVGGTGREIEVHIHQEIGEGYGRPIRIEFISRLRDELKFDTVDELVDQIKLDKEKSTAILSQS
ncbi:MAG TPA: bifunctional riboflavin kinase/FAD synthetase [bacterium]|nr:bifunctional riboflavin kinase/FAD synthetase [bacterium]